MASPRPPLVTVLSQHAMLTSLCNNLSSADIVHLGATCREAKTYILDSETIFQQLKGSAKCDGRGIVARKRVFGHQNEYDCLEGSERPCSDCGAMVCDECRFHLNYGCVPDQLSDANDREELREIERDYSDTILNEWLDDNYAGTKALATRIHARKASDIWWKREKRYCLACHPLLVCTGARPCCGGPIDSDLGFFEHFVGQRWLCLPCFFVEEESSIEEPRMAVTGYNPSTSSYRRERLCDCGQVVHEKSTQTCRYCGAILGWYHDFEQEVLLPKILDQLGFEEKMEGEMAAVYAQLG